MVKSLIDKNLYKCEEPLFETAMQIVVYSLNALP